MGNNQKPVFYTESDKRWKAFKGTLRIILFIVILGIVSVGINILSESNNPLPKLNTQNEIYKQLINPEHIAPFTTKLKKTVYKPEKDLLRSRLLNRAPGVIVTPAPKIRAGFYVNWDIQSYYSLRNNISSLNMVMPEWFFVGDNFDTLSVDIDTKALDLMEGHNIRILPMISNYYNNQWNPANIERIISDPKKTKRFIGSVLTQLLKYKFSGVNIDFESLDASFKNKLNLFQKQLYSELNKRGFIVTQDIQANEESHDVTELSKYNDYLVLMAYDLHYAESDPGPLADVNWVKSLISKIVNQVDPDKIILGIAGYGYDWPQGDEGDDITYPEALVTARESDAEVKFDPSSSNCSYSYYDDNDHFHNVWLTDAASTFNIMRISADYGINSAALWRLGGEDPRIWKFFNKYLTTDSLKINQLDLKSLEIIPPDDELDFEGEGDILNIVSSPQTGNINIDYDAKSYYINDEKYLQLPTSYVIRKLGLAAGKTIVLSFDDGPDKRYTPAILDILKKENVHADFFMLGLNIENNLRLVKRVYDEGNEIGNHTFSHPNLAITSNERTKLELNSTRRLIESITGHSTSLFRPPYDADTEPEHIEELLPILIAKEENYLTIGAGIDPLDWQIGTSPDSIVAHVIAEHTLGDIVLLHDAGGDRSATVKALPYIIKYFKDNGYKFTTVSGLLGKTRDDVMPVIKDRNQLFLSDINWTVAEIIFWIERFIFGLFFTGIILAVLRMLIVGSLAWIQKIKSNSFKGNTTFRPKVSIIVPAYNEAIHVVRNVQNLMKCDYQNFEIVFVDDGSTDNTYSLVKEAFQDSTSVHVFTKPNWGKSSALNFGIEKSEGEILVCIDADTQLQKDAVRQLVSSFTEEGIAAVAGNVKAGNEVNFISKWQSIEYITSQNFDRRAFDLMNAITVIPGAIGAFRKDAILKTGGFSSDTLAEDCDLTIKLLRLGYKVKYNDKAIAYTEVPETIKMFMRQRFRWSFGIMQNMWKHGDTLFNRKYKNLGYIALPNIILFHFILPVLSPFAELIMIFGIIGGFWQQIITYYILFLAFDFGTALLAFSFEKEKLVKLWLILPQRIIYRQLMYWVLIKSIVSAIRGTLVGWGILKRTGKLKPV